MESKINYDVDLHITRNVKDAINYVENNNYDLVITDIGLPSELPENKINLDIDDYKYGNYKTWEEIVPEHYKKYSENYKMHEKELGDEWKEFGNKENSNPKRQALIYAISVKSQLSDNPDEPVKLESLSDQYMGNYIAKLAKEKFPTVIHTASGHFEDTAGQIRAHNHASLEDLSKLYGMRNEMSDFAKLGIVYVSRKKRIEDFANVINDAIRTHVKKRDY